MTFTIQGRLAGANEMIAAHNRHRMIAAKLKKSETHRCALAAIAGGTFRIVKPITIHFHWFEPNKKRDLDNIRFGAKNIVDGLRLCGKLPNDGWAWIVGMSDTFSVDKVNPRIEIELKEVKTLES